jgi:hypothetical protein
MASLNMAGANEAVVKNLHFTSEMSQNFYDRGEVELARQSLEFFGTSSIIFFF